MLCTVQCGGGGLSEERSCAFYLVCQNFVFLYLVHSCFILFCQIPFFVRPTPFFSLSRVLLAPSQLEGGGGGGGGGGRHVEEGRREGRRVCVGWGRKGGKEGGREGRNQ